MEEKKLTITGEQMDRIIQWFYQIQRPQDIDEVARQYIDILKREQS